MSINDDIMFYHSDWLVTLSLLVQHLFQQVELTRSHNHNCNQLQNCEIFDLGFVACYYLRMDYLSLLFK